MMVERLSGTIVNSQKTINKPLPLWLTKEQKETYYDDMERIKIKIEVYEKLLQLPHIMMEEYGESEFRVNMSDNV